MLAALPRVAAMGEAASVYPGVQNLLLTARALGLGATMTTLHLLLEREFKAVLGIPRHTHTFAMVPVGWPRGRFGPVKRRPVADVIRWNRW
jgi:nitroreductase